MHPFFLHYGHYVPAAVWSQMSKPLPLPQARQQHICCDCPLCEALRNCRWLSVEKQFMAACRSWTYGPQQHSGRASCLWPEETCNTPIQTFAVTPSTVRRDFLLYAVKLAPSVRRPRWRDVRAKTLSSANWSCPEGRHYIWKQTASITNKKIT